MMAASGGHTPAPDGRRSTILLVEDNPDDAFLARIEFDDAGVRNDVVLVEDGEQTLRYLRGQHPFQDAPAPGLILLDLHLPKVDGHEVLTEIDGDPALRIAPIVVVSVPTELAWAEEQFGHLLAGVLPKPIQIGPLREVLATIDGLGTDFLV